MHKHTRVLSLRSAPFNQIGEENPASDPKQSNHHNTALDASHEARTIPRNRSLHTPSQANSTEACLMAPQQQSEPAHRTQAASGSHPSAQGVEYFVFSLTRRLKDLGQSSVRKIDDASDVMDIYREECKARPIEHEIRQWRKFLPETLQAQLNIQTWETHREQLPNTSTFSAFLSKLRHGFLLTPHMPSFSWSKGIYCKQKYEFAQTRLLPVLLSMQHNLKIAARLCCMAEDGLGNCHDRPVLTFVDMELEVKCEQALSDLQHQQQHQPNTSLAVDQIVQNLLALEAQKLTKSMAISWLSREFLHVPIGDFDPEQNVVVSYDKIAKATQLFPAPPYVSATSFVDANIQRDIRERVTLALKHLNPSWLKERLHTHLMASDNWIRVLVSMDPDLGQALAQTEAQRLQASEALVHNLMAFDEQYAAQLDQINTNYMRARTELLWTEARQNFTHQHVDAYLKANNTAEGQELT